MLHRVQDVCGVHKTRSRGCGENDPKFSVHTPCSEIDSIIVYSTGWPKKLHRFLCDNLPHQSNMGKRIFTSLFTSQITLLRTCQTTIGVTQSFEVISFSFNASLQRREKSATIFLVGHRGINRIPRLLKCRLQRFSSLMGSHACS